MWNFDRHQREGEPAATPLPVNLHKLQLICSKSTPAPSMSAELPPTSEFYLPALQIRGVNVGQVVHVKPSLAQVDVLVDVKEANTVIPRNSLIEANQSGLIATPLIDITPQLPIPDYKVCRTEPHSTNNPDQECAVYLPCNHAGQAT